MSRPPTAVLTLVLGLTLATGAGAGDYHKDETLLCSQCHIMHFSQAHGYNPSGTGFYLQPGAGGPHRYLLRNGVNDLCLACHDATAFAPDVLGSAHAGGDVRLGGYLNRLGIGGLPATGHTLDSLETAPGSDPPWKPEDENGSGRGLSCINCHEAHGDGGVGHQAGGNQYRNLRSDPGDATEAWVTYNHETVGSGINDLTRDVFERTPGAYDEGDVDWNEPHGSESAIANWCSGCHTNFHGPASIVDDHPTDGDDLDGEMLALYNSKTNKVKVMSEIGVWNPAQRDVTPTCITCHKAHGNGNPDGLIFRSGTGTLTENGDANGSEVAHLCGQCHRDESGFFNP